MTKITENNLYYCNLKKKHQFPHDLISSSITARISRQWKPRDPTGRSVLGRGCTWRAQVDFNHIYNLCKGNKCKNVRAASWIVPRIHSATVFQQLKCTQPFSSCPESAIMQNLKFSCGKQAEQHSFVSARILERATLCFVTHFRV